MRIGIPHQHADPRVAATTKTATKLIAGGHEVLVERGAGERAGVSDDALREVGVEIVDASTAWAGDFVLTVNPPAHEELAFLVEGGVLAGLLTPLERPKAIADLATTGITALAYELLPRTTRSQTMDVLSSQATVAGYRAVIEAASRLPKFLPMLTTAAGTIRPASVLVLGAGVAGLQAIATSRRLGAAVSAFDVRQAAAEQVESLGARFVSVDVEAQDARESGGYAREVADEQQRRILAGLAPHVIAADAVITTAAIPGRAAPVLVTEEMVDAMAPGSVIIDVAAATGGNCELTVAGEVIDHKGVTIVGHPNLATAVPTHASEMLSRNGLELLLYAAPEGHPTIDTADEILGGMMVTHGGAVTHPRVIELLEAS